MYIPWYKALGWPGCCWGYYVTMDTMLLYTYPGIRLQADQDVTEDAEKNHLVLEPAPDLC